MPLTVHQKFNIVAPIVIYHKADLMYKKEAKKAFKLLKQDEELFALMGRPAKLDEIYEFEPYNTLFRQIVTEVKPDWREFRDQYGARGYRDGDNVCIFTGDASNFFPWYVFAEGLIKRLGDN